MRSSLLMICLSLSVHSYVFAQSSWFKIHDLGFKYEDTYNVVPFGNDFILMTFCQNGNSTRNEVIRFDQFGEIKWRTFISYPPSADADVIAYYTDGIVVTKDSSIYNLSASKSLDDKYEFLINKFDKDGQLIWHKPYGMAGKNIQSGYNGLTIAQDSLGVIMAGSDVGSGKLAICQIDSSGEVIWHKIINVPVAGNVGVFTPTIAMPDKSIKVAYDNNVILNYHDYLVSLDSNGNMEYSYANPLTGKAHDLKLHPNGNLVYLSNERNPPMPEYGGLRIQMLTPEFDTVWSHLFYDTEFPYLFLETAFVRNLSISPDGKILAMGYNVKNCILLCYNPDGTLLWKREVALEGFDQLKFNFMTWSSDGGILMDGYISGTEENNQYYSNIFLLKLDSIGCLEPGCQQTIITDTKELELVKADFDISPNPTRGEVKVSYKGTDQNKIKDMQIKVHDGNGKLVFQGNFGLNGQPVALNQLASGVYVVSISNNNGVIYVSKIIKI